MQLHPSDIVPYFKVIRKKTLRRSCRRSKETLMTTSVKPLITILYLISFFLQMLQGCDRFKSNKLILYIDIQKGAFNCFRNSILLFLKISYIQ